MRLSHFAPSLLTAILSWLACAQSSSVAVSNVGRTWTVAGSRRVVVLDGSDFSVSVRSGSTTWKMVRSSPKDMLVNAGGDEFNLALTDAREIRIAPYYTGFKKGVKFTLDGFHSNGQKEPGSPLGLRLVLTMCLEGEDEELVWEAAAIEREAVVRELNWPKETDGRDVDYTVISSDDGTLLPRNWPKPYHPIHRAAGDESIIQSHLIESWSMSWWGFLKGGAAMIVIVETPDDAAYTFSHPAGGPTSMGPSWRAQLGRFAYPRSVRMAFLSKGNYVDLSKRYRRYVMDSGLYVSLRSKIAQTPTVKNLIGTPIVGLSVLRNLRPGAATYDPKDPAHNYHLTTFAENIQKLREFKAKGFQKLNVHLTGWLNMGYDRQTPDALPPCSQAGGWDGMKAFFDACKELGYMCWLHDQYRDYYTDAPSWNPDFAVHEEDSVRPPTAFPGTRFKKDWKDGYIPFMDHWDGGTQGYLNSRFMLGHVVKNYRLLFEHGIHPQGGYQDVFGYIPPDQDFNPEHPNTRTDSMNSRAAVLNWTRNNLGIAGTEDGSDWTIPYVHYVTSRMNRSSSSGVDPEHEDGIPVPLYELVYHDAVVTTYDPQDLRGLLHGSLPQWWPGMDVDLAAVRRMAALHERLALVEMTNHEFLDKEYKKERTTFADGTTVTVDWTAKTVEIKPELAAH